MIEVRRAVADVIVFVENLLSTGVGLIVALIWTVARVSGDDQVLVTIDDFGEALLELYLWPVIITIMIVGSLIRYRRFHRRRLKQEAD